VSALAGGPAAELVLPPAIGGCSAGLSLSHGVKDDDGKVVLDDKDESVRKAKYGMHALRHFYASWCINRRGDGGLELPAKVIQERLGHSSIVITMDVYGHLFPRGDDAAKFAEAERHLLA
jgi:integrase